MGKRVQQLGSTRQIGPETTLQNILIVVENGGKGGRIKAAPLIENSLSKMGGALACGSTNKGVTDKWKQAVQFSVSNRFGNIKGSLSDCRLAMFFLMEEDERLNFAT
jgi:hypothetical protein